MHADGVMYDNVSRLLGAAFIVVDDRRPTHTPSGQVQSGIASTALRNWLDSAVSECAFFVAIRPGIRHRVAGGYAKVIIE